jgi:hypothetical protein
MKKALEELIRQIYKKPEYTNLRETHKDIDRTQWAKQVQSGLVDELKKQVDAQLLYDSDEDYDISELIKFFGGRIYLRVSFIGPYAYLSLKGLKGDERDEFRKMITKIKKVLKQFKITLLDAEEVQEEVPWLSAGGALEGGRVKVWNCLFCEY